MKQSLLKGRVVLKIGSSTITGADGFVDREFLAQLGETVHTLVQHGVQPIIVSSGAVALGRERLGLTRRPRQIHERQALAAVGQVSLMAAYEKIFNQHQLNIAQVLLTRDLVADREKYLNARATFEELLRRKVIPIVNENDTVATDELRFGDNDTLSATTAQMVGATVLVLMSDVPGFFEENPKKNPDAKPIIQADPREPWLDKMAGGEGSDLGSGGMATKLIAARQAAASGIDTYIILGKPLDSLMALLKGQNPGTWFKSGSPRSGAKKQWLRLLPEKGQAVINSGAAIALKEGKKSLLHSGVVMVEGEFSRGDLIGIRDEAGVRLALGLSNYDVQDARKLLGLKSRDIETALGFRYEDELVHRDLMVLADGSGTPG